MSDSCPHCGAPISESLRNCQACQHDLGVPNVRECGCEAERKALHKRFIAALAACDARGRAVEFDGLVKAVESKSGVVVTLLASVARDLLKRPGSVYRDYETLVEAGLRAPASPLDDKRRCAVGGGLFGSYANKITYGVLSIDTSGLPTYGDVYCRLRSETVKKRVSFTEFKSYSFVGSCKAERGHRCVWENREQLAASKLEPMIAQGQGESEWQSFLVHSDGTNRANDEIIEAHIFEGFTKHSVESMKPVDKKRSKGDQIDVDLALELFQKSGALGGPRP